MNYSQSELLDIFGESDVLSVLRKSLKCKENQFKSLEYKRSKWSKSTFSYLDFLITLHSHSLRRQIKNIKRSIAFAEENEVPEHNNYPKKISDKQIARAREISILEVVSMYSKDAPKRCGVQVKIRCPFPGHNDNKPSFYINEKKNVCWCWPCQKGGDPIKFIQHMEQCSFFEAVKILNKIS